jgi:hypothetical protein
MVHRIFFNPFQFSIVITLLVNLLSTLFGLDTNGWVDIVCATVMVEHG